jgi:hypothetical protein
MSIGFSFRDGQKKNAQGLNLRMHGVVIGMKLPGSGTTVAPDRWSRLGMTNAPGDGRRLTKGIGHA